METASILPLVFNDGLAGSGHLSHAYCEVQRTKTTLPIFLGARFATTMTCLPTSSCSANAVAIPATIVRGLGSPGSPEAWLAARDAAVEAQDRWHEAYASWRAALASTEVRAIIVRQENT